MSDLTSNNLKVFFLIVVIIVTSCFVADIVGGKEAEGV